MEKKDAITIVTTMMENDYFSQWLGISVDEVAEGYCKLEMKITRQMLNGFGIVHGGIAYSLADSALAFASNSHGRKSVSIETSISHLISCKEGDILIAEAVEESLGNKVAIYTVNITNGNNERVAMFKGTVYRTSKDW